MRTEDLPLFRKALTKMVESYLRAPAFNDKQVMAWFEALECYRLYDVEGAMVLAVKHCKTVPSVAHIVELIRDRAKTSGSGKKQCCWVVPWETGENLRCNRRGVVPLSESEPNGPHLCGVCEALDEHNRRLWIGSQTGRCPEPNHPALDPPFNDLLMVENMLTKVGGWEQAVSLYGERTARKTKHLVATYGSVTNFFQASSNLSESPSDNGQSRPKEPGPGAEKTAAGKFHHPHSLAAAIAKSHIRRPSPTNVNSSQRPTKRSLLSPTALPRSPRQRRLDGHPKQEDM